MPDQDQEEGWTADEIERILREIAEECLERARQHDCPEVRIYRQGFATALATVAERLGIDYTPSRLVEVHVLSAEELKALLELPL